MGEETLLQYSEGLSHLCGGEIWLKLENLQVTGSFKPKGVANRLLGMGPEERGRGVVASSSGNHALALGYVSKRLGIDAVVVVPEGTPKVKVEAIKAFGLELKMCDSVYGG